MNLWTNDSEWFWWQTSISSVKFQFNILFYYLFVMFCEMHVSIFRNSYAALLPSQATSSTPTNLQTINWRVGVFPHFCFSSDSCCGHQLKWQIATVCVESQTMKLLFASFAVRFAGMQFNALHAHTHESVCFFSWSSASDAHCTPNAIGRPWSITFDVEELSKLPIISFPRNSV